MRIFKSLLITVICAVTTLTPLFSAPKQANAWKDVQINKYETVHRYWSQPFGYHYYTININELGTNSRDYKYEGELGKIASTEKDYSKDGLRPLYIYKIKGKENYRYFTRKVNYDKRYEYANHIGYISTRQTDLFSVKIYEYHNKDDNGNLGDFLYTNSYDELGKGAGGWKYSGVLGYFAPIKTNPTPQPTPEPTPTPDTRKCSNDCIYRYWSPKEGRHYYTTDLNKLGYGKKGFQFEGKVGRFSREKKYGNNDLTRLYIYYKSETDTYRFTTKTLNEKGWRQFSRAGYISKVKTDKYNTPLIEYINTNDYFYTNNPDELGDGGYGWSNKTIIGWIERE